MRPDFPRNLPEFLARFHDEDACVEYVAASRWPDGWACPRCGDTDGYDLTARLLRECKGCRYRVSATRSRRTA